MSKIRDIEIPISNIVKGSREKRVGYELLSKWLHIFFKNGIQRLDDGFIGLGGELTENTVIFNENLPLDFGLRFESGDDFPPFSGFYRIIDDERTKLFGVIDGTPFFGGGNVYVLGESTFGSNNDTSIAVGVTPSPSSNFVSLNSEGTISGISLLSSSLAVADNIVNPTANASVTLSDPSQSGNSQYTAILQVQPVIGEQPATQILAGETRIGISKYRNVTGFTDYDATQIIVGDNAVSIRPNFETGTTGTGDSKELTIGDSGLEMTDGVGGFGAIIPWDIVTYPDTATAAADAGLASNTFFKVSNGDGTAALHVKE
jgi:hypothetical protein